MAGSKSDYLENAVLNHVLGAEVWTPPGVIYVALSSDFYTDLADGTAFSEITGAGAARVAVSNNTTNWPTAVSGVKSNAGTITFPTATSTWPEALSFYMLDALSDGNLLYGGDLLTPRTLLAGDTASFGPGALIVSED